MWTIVILFLIGLSPTYSTNLSSEGWVDDIVGIANSGGGMHAVSIDWAVWWSLNKQKPINDILNDLTAVGTNSGGSWYVNAFMYQQNVHDSFSYTHIDNLTQSINDYYVQWQDAILTNHNADIGVIKKFSNLACEDSSEICSFLEDTYLLMDQYRNAEGGAWKAILTLVHSTFQTTPLLTTADFRWVSQTSLLTQSPYAVDDDLIVDDCYAYRVQEYSSQGKDLPIYLNYDFSSGDLTRSVDFGNVNITDNTKLTIEFGSSVSGTSPGWNNVSPDGDIPDEELLISDLKTLILASLDDPKYFSAPSSAALGALASMNYAETAFHDAVSRNALAVVANKIVQMPWKVNTNPTNTSESTFFQMNLADGGVSDNSGLAALVHTLQQTGVHSGTIFHINTYFSGLRRLWCTNEIEDDDFMNLFEPQPRIFRGSHFQNATYWPVTDQSSWEFNTPPKEEQYQFWLSDGFVTTVKNADFGVEAGSTYRLIAVIPGCALFEVLMGNKGCTGTDNDPCILHTECARMISQKMDEYFSSDEYNKEKTYPDTSNLPEQECNVYVHNPTVVNGWVIYVIIGVVAAVMLLMCYVMYRFQKLIYQQCCKLCGRKEKEQQYKNKVEVEICQDRIEVD